MALSLVTYNIKTDVNWGAARQKEDFDKRSPELIKLLQERRFGDLVTLQEVPLSGVESLKEKLSDKYHVAHVQHFKHSSTDKNQLKSNACLVILLAKDRFEAPTKEIEVTTPGNPTVSLIVQAVENSSKKMVTIFDAHVLSHQSSIHPAEALVQKLKEVTTPEDWVVGGGDFSQVSGVGLQALMRQQAGIEIDRPYGATEPSNSDHLFARGLSLGLGTAARLADPMHSNHEPLKGLVFPPPGAPFPHTQPGGSFGEKVMIQFQKFSTPKLQEILDAILTKHASTEEGFEEAVKKDFAAAFEDKVENYLAVNLLAIAFRMAKAPPMPIEDSDLIKQAAAKAPELILKQEGNGPKKWEPMPWTQLKPTEPFEPQPLPPLWPEYNIPAPPPETLYKPLPFVQTPPTQPTQAPQTSPEVLQPAATEASAQESFVSRVLHILATPFRAIAHFFRWLFGRE